MISLALVRHAKAEFGDPRGDDHARALTARGREDAPNMARTIAGSGFRPQTILSSSAVRARQTADAFGEVMGVDVVEDPALYSAVPEGVVAAARATGAHSVLVVGHDPTMSTLARHFSPDIVSMPTCAVAVFTWEGDDWDPIATTPPRWTSFDAP